MHSRHGLYVVHTIYQNIMMDDCTQEIVGLLKTTITWKDHIMTIHTTPTEHSIRVAMHRGD